MTMWRIAAGRGGRYIGAYLSRGIVTIGWRELGDPRRFVSRESMIEAARAAFPTRTERQLQVATNQIWRFIHEVQAGDDVVSYDPGDRIYHVGRVKGGAEYMAGPEEELETWRPVQWTASVRRDNLSVASRNSLGAIQTLIKVPEEAASELRAGGSGHAAAAVAEDGVRAEPVETADPYAELFEKSVQRVQDMILDLGPYELQDLVAALLRALGYRTIVSPAGPDRGRDIIASKDGFGFERPRIVVEVKHRRNERMGAPEIRSFIGGRHADDRGLYVSTGGFSQEARYEAERAATVTHLMDLQGLARAVIEQYDHFDEEGRALLSLRRLYWPADPA